MTATTSEFTSLGFGTLENSFTKEMTSILHSGIASSFLLSNSTNYRNWPEVATRTFSTSDYDTLKTID
jgi:hypothetical protein